MRGNPLDRGARIHAGDLGTCTVFVALVGQKVDGWQPVEAEPLDFNAYRLGETDSDPEGEVWEFVTGELVRCERRPLGDGAPVLVAVEKAERTGIRQPFLVCYDHGQGGIWAFIVAESAPQIRQRHPELFIANRMPAWVTPGVIERLPRHELQAPSTGLLADLDRSRAKA